MNRDPAKIGRAKVSAHTMAVIINSFIDPISWKAIVRSPALYVVHLAMLTIAALLPCYDIHRHRREQLVLPFLQKPPQPARIPTPSPIILPPGFRPICPDLLVTGPISERPQLRISRPARTEARTRPEPGRKARQPWLTATRTSQNELSDGTKSRAGESTALSQSRQTAQFAVMASQ